jgi:hypothetical protein
MRKILAFFLVVAMPALAQVKLEWPRSFTGQPDFEFTREEALSEARSRAARAGETPPQLPSILTLATDEAVPDPLRLISAETTAEDGTLRLEETLADPLAGMLTPAGNLPQFTTPTVPNLREFKATLAQTIVATIEAWRPDPARFDLANVVNGLLLQAIVTSPNQYATINGGRYGVGSSFLMRIPVNVPDGEIMLALEAEMPAVGTFDEATMAAYRAAYEEALAEFASTRTRNPGFGQQALNLPVVVKEIHTRKVVLDVNGQPYDLGMRYKY